MARRLSFASRSTPVGTVDPSGPDALKAARIALLGRLLSEALRRGEGSHTSAALSMRKDLALLGRQVKHGRLRVDELADLNDAFFAEWGQLLVEQFGAARQDPKARARARLPELFEALLEAIA